MVFILGRESNRSTSSEAKAEQMDREWVAEQTGQSAESVEEKNGTQAGKY